MNGIGGFGHQPNPPPEKGPQMPNTTDSTEIEHENRLDLLRPHADKLLMAALAQGHYRLAVQCGRCGTWLVAPASIKRLLGPVCARHAKTEAGAA